MHKQDTAFNLHLISDATGETLISLGRAVAAQYSNEYKVDEHIYIMVRNRERLTKVIDNIAANKGIVLYTMVSQELSQILEDSCKELSVPCRAVLEPIFAAFQDYFKVPAIRRVSAQHVLNEEYFKRQEALNYSLAHDDGQLPGGLAEADIILLGISRTSKTPTSLYLANRGFKTANIPIILDMKLPAGFFAAESALKIGLIARISRIASIRKNRPLGSIAAIEQYSDRRFIHKEMMYAKQIYDKYNIPVIDVTNHSVEEIATNILAIRKIYS